MEYLDVIKKRRSIRRFKDTPVPDYIVNDILESARLAPSGGNGQGWLFGVVTDKEAIKQLSIAAGNQGWIATAPMVIALCANLKWELSSLPEGDFGLIVNQERFTPDFIKYLQEYPDQKAVSLLFLNSVPLIPGEHIYLAAVNHGLSACWVGYINIHKCSQILSLPDEYACLFLLPVGYADMEPREITKKKIHDITFFNRYGRKQH